MSFKMYFYCESTGLEKRVENDKILPVPRVGEVISNLTGNPKKDPAPRVVTEVIYDYTQDVTVYVNVKKMGEDYE